MTNRTRRQYNTEWARFLFDPLYGIFDTQKEAAEKITGLSRIEAGNPNYWRGEHLTFHGARVFIGENVRNQNGGPPATNLTIYIEGAIKLKYGETQAKAYIKQFRAACAIDTARIIKKIKPQQLAVAFGAELSSRIFDRCETITPENLPTIIEFVTARRALTAARKAQTAAKLAFKAAGRKIAEAGIDPQVVPPIPRIVLTKLLLASRKQSLLAPEKS